MVSLTVGDVQGHEEWHLPTFDPRNENKYHYKLHSLDIYFWTQGDALDFVNGIRRVLPPNQVDVQDEPGPPPPAASAAVTHHHHQPAEVSGLVQKLENAAISENNKAAPSMLPGPPPNAPPGGGVGVPSFAPPPLSAVSAGAGNDGSDDPTSATTTTSAHSFVPMAYNPAAPAAPEQIRHREKTPPPEDDIDPHPLHARLAQDANTPFSPGLVSGMPHNMSPLSPGIPPPQFHAQPGAPSFPGPPIGSPGLPPQGYGSGGGGGGVFGAIPATPMTPGHPGLQRAVTVPVTAHGGVGGFPTSPAPLASPYGQPQQQHQQTPGVYTPTYPQQHAQQQIQQTTHTPTPPPVTSPGLPPPPPGGYSNYSYTTQQGGGHAANDPYAIHQMAYRPTENEQSTRYAPKKEVRGRLEENAGRLEKGVTGMLKRFEKKFG